MEIASSGERPKFAEEHWDISDVHLLWAASDADQRPKQENGKYRYIATTSSFMTLLWPSFIQPGAVSVPKLNPQLPDSGLGEGSSRSSGEGALSSRNSV